VGRTENILYRLHIDVPLASAVAIMCMLGAVVLYSASEQSTDVMIKQGVRIMVGFGAMLTIAQVSPRRLSRWAPALYLIGLMLLVLVLFVGTGRGAQRWLDLGFVRFQPSELMKLAVPLTVAFFLSEKVLPPKRSTHRRFSALSRDSSCTDFSATGPGYRDSGCKLRHLCVVFCWHQLAIYFR